LAAGNLIVMLLKFPHS